MISLCGQIIVLSSELHQLRVFLCFASQSVSQLRELRYWPWNWITWDIAKCVKCWNCNKFFFDDEIDYLRQCSTYSLHGILWLRDSFFMDLHEALALKAALNNFFLKLNVSFLSNNINQVYHWTTFPCSFRAHSAVYHYNNLLFKPKKREPSMQIWKIINNVGFSWPRNVFYQMIRNWLRIWD